MKKAIIISIFIFLAFGTAIVVPRLFLQPAEAVGFSCQVRAGSCLAGETAVLKMSDTANAHAELPNQTNYSNSVCCGGAAGLGNSCSGNYDVALKLSALTNAHVEKKTLTNYSNRACLSAPSAVSCSYASDCSTLGPGFTTMVSISADTNAHVGNASAYATKVCCSLGPGSGSPHNVSGFAWSENIGWISFNSTNCDNNGDGFSDGVPVGCPPDSSSVANYGVNIDDDTGEFSGYAWSENIGWIDFGPSGPYPASPNYSACLDFPGNGQVCDDLPGNDKVGGWARALAFGGGWDGWIKLRGTALDGSAYGVSIDDDSGYFSGYAWSDAVIGWISFEGAVYRVGTSIFGNEPPDKPSKIGDGEEWSHCSFREKSIPTFSWTPYSDPDGDPQAAYEVEVDDNSSFAAPKFNHMVNLAAASYTLDLTQDDTPDWISELAWNTTYHWRVRVKDNKGNWSEWSNSDQFQTPPKAYPWPEFSWSPPEPTQGEIVYFTPEETEFSHLWTITPAGGGTFEDETAPTSIEPHIKFSTLDNKIKHTITDSSSPSPARSCEREKDVIVQLPLPEYKEIPPIIWFKKLFGGLVAFVSRF